MVLNNFRRSIPRRKRQLAIFLVSFATAIAFVAPKFTANVVPGVPIPDLAFGYTPQQALAWYEAIGIDGRAWYLLWLFLHLYLVIPSYALLFGSHLLERGCPEFLCYAPALLGCLNLIDATYHGYNCYSYDAEDPPSTRWLHLASGVTKAKLVTFAAVLAMCAYFSIRPKVKVKDKAS